MTPRVARAKERFLADESVERGVLRELRSAGHDVRAIAEERPGATDAGVLALARVERRVLLTNDKDFAELVFGRRSASFRVILMRLRDWNAGQKAARLAVVLEEQPSPRGAFLVVFPGSVRRRRIGDRR